MSMLLFSISKQVINCFVSLFSRLIEGPVKPSRQDRTLQGETFWLQPLRVFDRPKGQVEAPPVHSSQSGTYLTLNSNLKANNFTEEVRGLYVNDVTAIGGVGKGFYDYSTRP